MKSKILVINPGSTSTKIAMYDGKDQLWQENIEHDAAALARFESIFGQLPMRLALVREAVKAHGDRLEELAAVSARGGLLPPVSAGAYEVNELMLDVLENRPQLLHASNLGAAIAYNIANPLGIKAYIYDPVTVDEMMDIVRITGLKEVRRAGRGHNLNMRAAALKYCEKQGCRYEDATLIVAHLGGGISVSLHTGGKVADLISDDEGAFSPERAGLIPAFKVLELRKNMNYTDMMKKLQRQGGLISHLGTANAREVEERVNNGDAEAKLVYEAMALSVAQGVGREAVIVNGRVDAIILTGGIARSEMFTDMIKDRVAFIAPVVVLPGENEMQALAEGAWRVLNGKEEAREYRE